MLPTSSRKSSHLRNSFYFERVNLSMCLDLDTLDEEFFSLDLEHVTPPHKSLAEMYQCSICHRVSFHLYECPSCQSNTCSACYERYEKCTNRCYGQMIPISKKTVRTIKSLNVKCSNKGCETSLSLEELSKHERTVSFRSCFAKRWVVGFKPLERTSRKTIINVLSQR